jgi:hypothetical protein
MQDAIVGFIATQNPTSLPKPQTVDDLLELCDPEKNSDNEFFNGVEEFLEATKGRFPRDKKDIENRLAQNEIILVAAVFEDMMKSIHREILRQNPKLLDADRQINLGKLAAMGESAVIAEEIERAVQSLDRKNVQDRAKAFEKLGMPWDVKPEDVEEILNLRNQILHEDTNILVNGWNLASMLSMAVRLPLTLCRKAARIYPNGFELHAWK